MFKKITRSFSCNSYSNSSLTKLYTSKLHLICLLKSTLFKILSKELSQDSGEVFVDKNKSLGYLSQHLDLDSNNTIYNEMLLVFEDLQRLEAKIADLEVKMNEPYDLNNAAYHEKIIKDYGTAQDLYENRGGYTLHEFGDCLLLNGGGPAVTLLVQGFQHGLTEAKICKSNVVFHICLPCIGMLPCGIVI